MCGRWRCEMVGGGGVRWWEVEVGDVWEVEV